MYRPARDKVMADMLKTTYKCKCGHSVVIANKERRALCKWCGAIVKAEGKTVYDIAVETRMKKQYEKFLKKKEKKQNENRRKAV